MSTEQLGSTEAPEGRDYSALIIIAILSTFEIAALYVLIATETPLTPMVQRLMRNPPGVFTLVMIVVCALCAGMVLFLTWVERRAKKLAPRDQVSAS